MRCFAAWSLFFIGQPDQAVVRIQQALRLAHELAEPHGLAHALLFGAILYQLRREAPLAQELAEAAIAVSAEHGLVMYEAMATTARGWALIERGEEEQAIAEIRRGTRGAADNRRPAPASILSLAAGRRARKGRAVSTRGWVCWRMRSHWRMPRANTTTWPSCIV